MTESQARHLAKQIFDRFDKRIYEACLGTVVPPSFVAGLVGNEAGKDRQGNIVESATRFEPHVFAALKDVRSGARGSYNRITRRDIADATDAALRALATSYGATQIMGWHVIHNLHCTIADLRNPDKHFFYTVKLLLLNGFPDHATGEQMDREMRQWNTGRETGKTYHENYVPNARMVRAAYRELEEQRVHRTVEERTDPPAAAAPLPDLDDTPGNDPVSDQPASDQAHSTGSDATTQSPAKTETVEVKKERTSPWARVLAIFAAIGGLGINAGTLVQQRLENLSNAQIGYLLAALGLVWLGYWLYNKGADRAARRTEKLIEKAADPTQLTVEVKKA